MDDRFMLYLRAKGDLPRGSRTDVRLVGSVFFFTYPHAAIALDELGQFPVQQKFVISALSGRRKFARRVVNASGELELSEFKHNVDFGDV